MSTRRIAIRVRNPQTGEWQYFSPRFDEKWTPVRAVSPTGDPGSWEDLELVYLDEPNGLVIDAPVAPSQPVVPPAPSPPDYDHQVGANLDPTGRVVCFMSNRDRGGNRYDVYLAPIPQ